VVSALEERPGLHSVLKDAPTMYFGGGTPTVLGDELPELVRRLRSLVQPAEDAEITVETNPETTRPALLDALMGAGVNRFSLGVQAFDDEVLRELGRCHDAARAREAATELAARGVRFSVDLICGVPGQSMASWRESVEEAVATGAGHASVYSLSIEPGTPLETAVGRGEVPEPDPDVAAEMMLEAERIFSAAGLERYEVASYARAGEESLHNLGYWTARPYVGVGPSAASMLPLELLGASGLVVPSAGRAEGAAGARIRFALDPALDRFLTDGLGAIEPEGAEYLSAEEAQREDVMLGLRLTVGVTSELVEEAGLTSALGSLEAEGLVELSEGRWRTTRRGWLLGNEVFSRVWVPEG
jgi:oxygen-independent coproporphyrinogen-3 oxidase